MSKYAVQAKKRYGISAIDPALRYRLDRIAQTGVERVCLWVTGSSGKPKQPQLEVRFRKVI